MRATVLVLVAAAGCGRLSVDDLRPSDALGPPDALVPSDVLGPSGDAVAPMDGTSRPIELACGETVSPSASAILGSALEVVVTTRGLVALWLDPDGALLGTTFSASAGGGATVVDDAVPIAPGPFTGLRAAANQDAILIVVRDASGTTARVLHGDLTPAGPIIRDVGAYDGRAPLAQRRGGPGFVSITTSSAQPAILEIDNEAAQAVHLIPELVGHQLASIAAEADGYAVVTELTDPFGPGCWYTKISDGFMPVLGPGPLESTQQADCDSSITSPTAGLAGVGMTWMDRDPASSQVGFRGTVSGSGFASAAGDIAIGEPLIAASSAGFAVIYRSAAALRGFDASGVRTLASSVSLADLVTWSDRAIALWTTPSGAPQLTRLCP